MASYNKFNTFVADVANKIHNLGSDTLMVALSDVAPSAGNTVLANITQISYANLASSQNIITTSSLQSSGTYKLILQNLELISGGTLGPFRYIVIYNGTAAGNPLIGWYDYGSELTLNIGDTLTLDFDGVNGVLELV